MRRQLNRRFLLGLLVGLMVLGVGTHFLHAFQVKRNAGNLLEQASLAEERGDLSVSAEYLGRYLGLVPDDTDALVKYSLTLGKLARDSRSRAQAFFALEQALRRAPNRDDVRRQLVKLAFQLRRLEDARDHLVVLLQAAPTDAGLLHQMGACEEGRKQYPVAAEWFGKAIRQHPHEVDNYVRLADLLRHQLGSQSQADQKIEELVTANPDLAAAHLARARYYREVAAGDAVGRDALLKKGSEAITRASELAPQDVEVLLEAAEVAQAQGKVADARTSLQRGMEVGPGNVRVYQSLASLEQKAGRRAEAIACLRRGLQASPGQGELLWPLAELLTEGDEMAEANEVITRLDQSGYLPPLVDYLKARQLMKKGEWRSAIQAFEAVLPLIAKTPDLKKRIHLYQGQCHGELGDGERQYAATRQAVDIDPLWIPGCLQLAATLAAQGRLDEAIAVYDSIAPVEPRARVLAVRLIVLRTLRLPPTQRNWQDVERALSDVAAHMPDAVEIPLLRAEIYASQDQPAGRERAWKVLEEARDRQPKQVEYWIGLADLARLGGEDPLKVVDQATRALGDRVELRLYRIRSWGARPRAEAEKELAKLGQHLEAYTVSERQRLGMALAEAYVQTGIPREALRFYHRLAEQKPNDLNLRLRMFDLAVQVGDEKEAPLQPLIDDVRRIEGEEGALWRYGKACQLIRLAFRGDKKGLAEADRLLIAAATRRPHWTQVCLRRGEISEVCGDPDTALVRYQQAIDLGDHTPPTIRRVVQLLYERHRYADADKVLQKLQDRATRGNDLDRLGSEVALHQNDIERAVELARRAVADDSRDHRALIWLGQVLLAAGKPAEAEPVLRRAVTLSDQEPISWVALAQALVRMGLKQEAEEVLRDAERKLSAGPKKLLVLAAGYEVIGRRDDARKQYEAALTAYPQDVTVLRSAAPFYLRMGDINAAERQLRTLMAQQNKASEDASWARRTLALGLAATGDYQRSQTALALLGLAEGPDKPTSLLKETVDTRRAQAVVLAVQKNTRHRRQAITRLEDLRRTQEATAEDQFLLAQLYDGIGDWPKARKLIQQLLAENSDSGSLLAAWIQGLLRHEETDEAQTWFTRLEEREPSTFRTLSLKALLLHSQGKGGEAVPFLQAVAKKNPDILRPVALLLEQIGQVNAAEDMYREFVSQSTEPERVLVLAGFLGRQNRPDDALALCEPAWKNCPPTAVADTSVTVLYTSKVSDEQCQRVADWLEDAIRNHPDLPGLSFQLANVRHMQGRHADAVTLFRQVIEREPNHALALNNLAWLLVLKEGKATEALELIQRAVRSRGDTAELLDTRGVIYLALGKSDLAIQDLEEAVAQMQTAARLFHLARTYQTAGKHTAALTALKRADRLGLHEERLEPLERTMYRQVRDEIGKR